MGGTVRDRLGAFAAKTAKRLGHDPRLEWRDAQSFELSHAIQYMQSRTEFQAAVDRCNRPECYLSSGYVDRHVVSEFFGGDEDRFREFVSHITKKAVLDIGPCLATPISLWDVASSRQVIEPLYDAVSRYQLEKFGRNCFVNIDRAYSEPAEALIAELVGQIDGAILVRNCIDHSPKWPFILSNIAQYAAPGCQLLLWNDLMHPPRYLDGHYDITDDAQEFSRLLETLGFRIDYEFELHNTECLDYGCRATKNA